MSDQILPKGVRLFAPHASAPSFVKGSLVITLNELVQFCKDNPALMTEYNGNKQIKLQLLESKDGKPYCTVDTYKPGSTPKKEAVKIISNDGTDDLPF